jgi:hypothetical protein
MIDSDEVHVLEVFKEIPLAASGQTQVFLK